MSELLKEKTIRGVGWSALDNVLSYAMTFVIGVILARLLSPDDYGLIGLIGIFTGICNCFINAGFSNALIRKKEATSDDFNTVFICNFVMSIVMYGVVFAFAPLIATFFGRSELIVLTRVSSLGMIIGALGIVQSAQLSRRIDFKTQTKITIISIIVQGIVGITLAFSGFGVWALVWQGITSSIIRTLLLWLYNHWIPSLYFSMQSFRELFGYSSKLLAGSLIESVWEQLYQVVIGKCYTPAMLGQYTRATGYSTLFSTNLVGVVRRVSFPALSQIQDDAQRLKGGYKRIIKITMLFTFSCTLLLAAIAKPLLIVLVGFKWLPAATFLQIICFRAMLHPVHSLNINMLQIVGRSDLYLRIEIIKKILHVGPLLLGIFINIYWMLIGSVFHGFICYYINAYYSGQFVNYNMREQVRDITPSFIIAFLVSLIVWLIGVGMERMLGATSTIEYTIILFLQIVIGVIFLYKLYQRYNLPEYQELKSIFNEYIIGKLKNHVSLSN